MSTNVPPPSFTPTGFTAPPESEILTGVQEDINAAFGGDLNFTTQQGSATNPTPQGQLAASMAAIIGNANDTFLFYSTQTDPAFAEGRMQDAIGRIYFIERIGSVPTTLQLQCVGAVGTIIPIGSLVSDSENNIYASLAGGTIGAGGSCVIYFAAQISGTLVSIPSSVAIYQAISGWDLVNLIGATPGTPTESRAAFEQRRGLSVAANSIGSLPSVLGTVLSVPGVTDAFVYENATANPVTYRGVVLPANSLYVAVAGGSLQNVARAIWSKKAPGCPYAAGNTTVTVQDTSPGYSPPYPSYQVTYQIPNPLPILFSVEIVNSSAVPSNATSLIQQAIVNAMAGEPNAQGIVDGPAGSIGGKIWASRFVPSVSALGSWAAGNVINIEIGSNNDLDSASAVGYCSGTLLTVTQLVSGTIIVGQTVSISNGSGVATPGTTIVAQVSGSAGGTGTYTVSVNQSVGISNLLLRSNTFNATWGTLNCTIIGSAGTSPDGTNDAWQWQRVSGSAASLSQSIAKTPAAVTYTFSLYAAPGSGNFLALSASDGGGNSVDATFNIATGVVAQGPNLTGTNPFTNAFVSITPATNGFYRCAITFTTNPIGTLALAFCGFATNIEFGNSDSSGSTSVLVFGAQLDLGSQPLTYIPTTTSQLSFQVFGFSTPDETSVQVNINQIPSVSPANVVVSYN